MDKQKIFKALELEEECSGVFNGEWLKGEGSVLETYSPGDGSLIAKIRQASEKEYEKVVKAAEEAFTEWRMVPAPKRGDVVYELGRELRKYKKELGALVTMECGKILVEGEGEVQEMIDICDFAVGQSRQLYGKTMHSERPKHRMYEQWHPLGIVGIITSFNFPVAVWAWNFAVSAVCGNVHLWKPSSKTPLTGVAVTKIASRVLKRMGYSPAIASLVIGSGREIGEKMINDRRLRLISATGSTRMGKRIGEVVGERLGRTILELGGNNAIIISDNADLKLALRAALFGAVGTAGQRCTTTRRLIIHEKVFDKFVDMLINAYKQVKIGDPLDPKNLMGPLIDKTALDDMQNAVKELKSEGGEVLYGGEVISCDDAGHSCYVKPCIARVENSYKIVQEETFAPILYVIKYKKLDDAIEMQNDVPQGLSSSIFTGDLLEAEQFLSAAGSDCGLANVNVGTSGAEIGGAFGGEKDTGGGRESGSDSWKFYMRRQTNVINWSTEMPLAQGIEFGGED